MRVGILGGDSLARLLVLSGYRLGFDLVHLTPSESPEVAQVAPQVVAAFDDTVALDELAARVDAVTCDPGDVPLETIEYLAERLPTHPGVRAAELVADRGRMQRFLRRVAAATEKGGPEVAVDVVSTDAPIDGRRLTLLGLRGSHGELASYPVALQRYRHGRLRYTLAPAPDLSEALAARAASLLRRILVRLEHVGVLALHFLEYGDGLALSGVTPWLDRAGNWTLDGAAVCQFENHLRALAGWSPGSTSGRGVSLTMEIVGGLPDRAYLASLPGARLHVHRTLPEAGRVLGHVTLRGAAGDDIERQGLRLEALLDSTRDPAD